MANLCLFCIFKGNSVSMKENSRKYLIFLTAGFPYGNGETFIENELPFLSQAFEKVYIVVPAGAATQPKRAVAGNVEIISVTNSSEIFNRLKALICPDFWKGLQMDLNRTNRLTGAVNVFRSCWNYFSRALATKKTILHTLAANNLKPKDTILYSYWLDDTALSIAMLKKKLPELKAFARAHRWDVYEEMHPIPILPFRPWMAKYLDKFIFISKQGKEYFESTFPNTFPENTTLSYLGTFPINPAEYQSRSGNFTILSCSSLIERKRVELIAKGILQLNVPVQWIHIGDGPEMEKILTLAKEIEEKGWNVRLLGNLSNQAVMRFYEENQIDLFISTSESEGLPVSMMEAQSAGIPNLATDVGGVNEIVIEGVTGWLLPSTPSSNVVAERIRKIFELPDTEKRKIRKNCFNHWESNFSAESNYNDFIKTLKDF